MINSDRSSRKHNDISNVSFLSDRNSQEGQNKPFSHPKIMVENDEVQFQRQKTQKKQVDESKGRLWIIDAIVNSIPPQFISERQKVCQICERPYQAERLINFSSCNHSFCSFCLKDYVKFKIENFQLISCPSEGCDNKLNEQSEVYKELLTEEERTKYKKVQLQVKVLSDPNLRLCKKQACQGIIDYKIWREQMTKHQQLPITCPKCKLEYCKECFQEKHEGTCEKNIIKFLQRNKKFRQCSVCKRVIQKTQGCTHMTCLCGNYFCYMCGQPLSTIEIHECNIPTHLNCLQKIRWQIQHMQMFYESNILSFHRCLYCFELPGKIPTPLRFLYSVAYFLSIYPISIVLSLVLVIFFLVLCLLVLTLLFLFLPLSEICTHKDYKITICLNEILGSWGLTLCIIMLYPVFVLAIMIESIYQVYKNEENWTEIGVLFKEIGTGFRNVLLMPFVLCVNPDTLDAAQEQLNDRIQNGV